MAVPPDSCFREVAGAIAQPASEEDVINRLSPYITGLQLYNADIHFRNSDNNQDITEAVYRWDTRSYEEIFRTGFTPRSPDPGQRMEHYYNLEEFVNGGGIPGDTCRADASVFVSTTRSARWRPRVSVDCTLYRYEIFSPGGIDANLTLGTANNFPNQQEISFAGGISPQYIRSARGYTVPVDRHPHYVPMDNVIHGNALFNPNPASDGYPTPGFFHNLRNPVCPSGFDVIIEYPARREKRSIEEQSSETVCSVEHYIECAFNFSDKEDAYLFIANRCLLIYYAPGTTDDKILKSPQSIADGFPYLANTIFASGIDAAFTASNKNEAYIFRSNIYALIKFGTDDDKIIQGPKLITDSFYSLKNTIFEKGIDAAFTSSKKNEAYIFKGDQYALINFAPGTTDDYIIQGPKKITLSFPSLKDTIFKDGFDAAFSSSKKNEAYIFKGNTYALIDYAPGTTDDRIVNGPITPVTDGFPSLKGILPMHPCGC